MGSTALFATASLIWGSTWLAITFQLGSVAPEASVVYRFALAAVLLAAWCAATGRSLRFSPAQHAWLALQGTLLFGLNYLGVYWAEQRIASGLAAVLFSLIVFFNLIGARLFFAAPTSRRTLAAAALGVLGVAVMFGPELSGSAGRASLGIGYALGATVFASAGNLMALRNQRHGLPVLPSVAWGMGYGALVIALVAAVEGTPWSFETSPRYVGSLVYLAVFGSVIAFGAYITLLGKIGPARAGYVGVAVPLVALALSTIFERYEWTVTALAGAALCIAGNALVLMRDRVSRAP
ncbi:MAG TPA: EamA family transporter [Casimicrobiaceae bacterium]|nr:EamA family transporter [Casimicrobiaceae bacterium]